MISQFSGYTSYQVNVDSNGKNIMGDAANEPSLTVDPLNHSRMAVGWRQFFSVNSDFRQAGYAYTTDAGKSWTFPGVLENGVFRSDPVLHPDAEGSFYYLSLLSTFYDDMWRSLNLGQSWSNLGSAEGGDKEWFTIDNTNSVGHGNQYQCWSTAGNNYGGRQFTRSTNGGLTWDGPVNIPNSPAWGTLDVDSNGVLYLAGVNLTTGDIWCERSSNARFAGVTPSFELSTHVELGGDIVFSQPINPEGLVGQVYVAVDRSGTKTNNNVYILASVQPAGLSGSNVMFVRSTDGGATFSAPMRVNDDPVNQTKWHWFGTLSVAPNGRLDAVWLDSRNAVNNTNSQLFYSYSTDGGSTWSANVPVSALFNPFLGYPQQRKMGDYISSVSDMSGVDVAYTATFNGEEDVYYVRISPYTSPLLNISTRVKVLTGANVAIGGFIITGDEPRQILLRGIGPSLSSAGVTGALPDPTLELHQGNTVLATNDNWKVGSNGQSQEAAIRATGVPPQNDLESAILITLSPGEYTAILSGTGGGTGVGLVEVYDIPAATSQEIGNISTRGFVGIDDNVMIGGTIIGPGGDASVLFRALGPSLSGQGVAGALRDPIMSLHDANGAVLQTNDNWKEADATEVAAITASGLAPKNDAESAILMTLAPGEYTAVVAGKNGATGVGLVEAYKLQ